MELQIGTRICNLRKERNVTQEQLAGAVGVSAPAVSKWETGSAYPDITLLPAIARFLGVTVDSLFGFVKDITPEQVMNINRDCARKFETEDFDSAIAYCDDFLHEYPDNLFLKFRIGGMIQQYLPKAESSEKLSGAIQKVISLFEKAAGSEDMKIRLASQAVLGSLYMMRKDYEKAEAVLMSIPRPEVNPDIMLPSLYLMQGKVAQASRLEQQNLFKSINVTVLSLTSMTSIARREKDYARAVKLAEAQGAVIRLFNLEKFMLLTNYILFLSIYTDLKDADRTLEYLDKYAGCIMELDFESNKLSNIEFFNSVDLAEIFVSSNFTRDSLVRSIRNDPDFDFIRDSGEYRAILARLEERLS